MAEINFKNIIENDFEESFYKRLRLKIINFLEDNNSASFWDIIRFVEGSDRRVLRLLSEMEKNDEIIYKEKKFSLNVVNKNYDKKNLILDDVYCTSCKSSSVFLGEEYKKLLRFIKDLYTEKPVPTFLYDQRPITAETTVRRVAYLKMRGDFKNKKIAIIGDDDLTSLALGFVNHARKIIVFEIDKRLVDFINKIAKKYGLDVKAYEYDLTKKIPQEHFHSFDVFITDPTPKPDPFGFFVAIGLHLLKKEPGKVGYVSFYPSHQFKDVVFQRILTEYNLIVTDMIPRFTEYDFMQQTYRATDLKLLEKYDSGEERLSFYENLTRFETTKETLFDIALPKIRIQDFQGKATKKTILDPKNDPAYLAGDKSFVLKAVSEYKDGRNE